MLLSELKYKEVEDYLTKKKTIILPCGSNEQHGLHCPLGNDSITAFEIAKEAGKQSDTIVAPVLPYGFSPGLHTNFPGTVSISGTTFIALITDILKSFYRSGFRNILLFNGHGLNYSPLNTAVCDFLDDHEAHIKIANYWELDQVKAILHPEEGFHTTVSETSIVSYLYPGLVDMEKAVHKTYNFPFNVGRKEAKKLLPEGVNANAPLANKEDGKRYFEAALSGIIGLLQELEKELI